MALGLPGTERIKDGQANSEHGDADEDLNTAMCCFGARLAGGSKNQDQSERIQGVKRQYVLYCQNASRNAAPASTYTERFSSVQVTGRGPSMERCLRGLRAFHPAIAWPGLPGLGSMSAAGREIARWLGDGRFSLCDRCGPLSAGRRAWSPATVSSIGRSA